MSYKFKYYAQPVSSSVKSMLEAGFIEFFIAIICTVFAFFTYQESLVLFWSCALIAVACYILTLFNIVMIVLQLRQSRNK